jgi:hypothetical protein
VSVRCKNCSTVSSSPVGAGVVPPNDGAAVVVVPFKLVGSRVVAAGASVPFAAVGVRVAAVVGACVPPPLSPLGASVSFATVGSSPTVGVGAAVPLSPLGAGVPFGATVDGTGVSPPAAGGTVVAVVG